MNADTYYCDTCEEWMETREFLPSTARRCLACQSFILCGVCGEVWTDFHADVCDGPESDTRGYRMTVTTTTVETRYVRGRNNADDIAYEIQAGGWSDRSTVDVTVARCEHDAAYCETVPVVPNGLTRYVRYTCEDCGETYDTRTEHDAVMVSRDPFYAPRVVSYYTESFTDGEDDPYHSLAHV